MKDTVYAVNYIGVQNEIFYQLDSARDDIPRPYIYLREAIEAAGYKFEVVNGPFPLERCAAFLSFCNLSAPWILEMASQLPKERAFLILTEPPVVHPQYYHPVLAQLFGTIFVLFDDLVDNKTYFKFYHHQTRETRVEPIGFEEKKLCVIIQSDVRSHPHPQELYSERYKTVIAFAPEEIDVYGNGWEDLPNRKGRLKTDKLQILKNYRFSLCYENMRNTLGCISERIFDAMYAACVPVYWGALNIGDYVPKECFIDRGAFKTNEELVLFLKGMDQSTYERYLNAAKNYLTSPQHEIYSARGFSNSITKKLLNNLRNL